MIDTLFYIGSATIILWGIAHVIPTASVVEGFGSISEDNKKIITMEWIAEGLAMIFIGLLVLLVTLSGTHNTVSVLVYRASAVMLIVMAGLTALTGARTAILPIKICPVIKTIVAALLFAGTAL